MTSQLFGGGLFENLSNAFEEDPLGQRALYQGTLANRGFTRTQQNALNPQFENTFGTYLGKIGQQIQNGQVPGVDDTFSNFLKNDFNPQRSLLQTSGLGGGGFGPTLFNFGGQ